MRVVYVSSAVRPRGGGGKGQSRVGSSTRKKLWFRMYRRRIDGGEERCRHCGSRGDARNPLTFDHLIAAALGHGLRFDNATILCRDCNQRKGVGTWAHLRSLAAEERAAPPSQRWYVLAAVESLKLAHPPRWAARGLDDCSISLGHHRRGVICWGCRLDPDRKPVTLEKDVADVLHHIEAHRTAGQHVPAWVDGLVRTGLDGAADRIRADVEGPASAPVDETTTTTEEKVA